MSDTPQGPGWWMASDHRYYPPPRPQVPTAQSAAQPATPSMTPWGPPVAPTPWSAGPTAHSPGTRRQAYITEMSPVDPDDLFPRTEIALATGLAVALLTVGAFYLTRMHEGAKSYPLLGVGMALGLFFWVGSRDRVDPHLTVSDLPVWRRVNLTVVLGVWLAPKVPVLWRLLYVNVVGGALLGCSLAGVVGWTPRLN